MAECHCGTCEHCVVPMRQEMQASPDTTRVTFTLDKDDAMMLVAFFDIDPPQYFENSPEVRRAIEAIRSVIPYE